MKKVKKESKKKIKQKSEERVKCVYSVVNVYVIALAFNDAVINAVDVTF